MGVHHPDARISVISKGGGASPPGRYHGPVTIDEAMDACAAFPASELTYPFGPETPVFKVVGKMFAALSTGERTFITLKSDPEDARALAQQFEAVTPGYHMNKKHWISVTLPESDAPLDELIRASYDLVVASLPRAKRPTPTAG